MQVGLGWLITVLRFPLIRWIIDAMYRFVSKHRHTISRFLPGGKALAAAVNSLNEVKEGAQGNGCTTDECELVYPDDDEVTTVT